MRYYSIETSIGVTLRIVNTLSIVAVNVFVLISGYFLSAQSFKLSRLVKLTIQVMVYSWLAFGVSLLRGVHFGVSDYLRTLFPISYKAYWFITAYFGMVLLTPFINRLFAALDKTKHLMVIIASLVVTSVLRDILFESDPFMLNKGYSFVWFVELYIIASYLRHHYDSSKLKRPLLWYFVFCFVMASSWALIQFLSKRFPFLEQYGLAGNWLRYNSLFNLLASVMLFLAFQRITIKRVLVRKAISFVAPLTLGVYLIHDNTWMRDFVWFDLLKTNTFEYDALLLPKYIASVLIVFVCCLLIDYLRTLLFHLFDRRKWYSKILARIDELPGKLYEKLKKYS